MLGLSMQKMPPVLLADSVAQTEQVGSSNRDNHQQAERMIKNTAAVHNY